LAKLAGKQDFWHLSSQTDKGAEVSHSVTCASAGALPVLSRFDGIEGLFISSGFERGEDLSGREHV
jgi:hypothetical protein